MATKVKLIADGVITPDQITLTTASTGTNTTAPATTAFVQQEISALVDSSPDALNTLNELAAALGDDANFSTTVTNSIATKLPLAGGSLTGALDITAAGNQLTLSRSGFDDILFGTGTVNGQVGFHITNTTDSVVPFSMHENAPAATLVVDSSGNVGIGTDNPSQKLDVAGNLKLLDGYLEFDKPSVFGFRFLQNDAGNDLSIQQGDANNANYVTRLNIDSSGNVGIGTDNPGRGLTIDRSGADAALNIVKNNTTNEIAFLGTGSSGAEDYGILQLSDAGTVKAQIYTAGVSYFNGGNVGINTSNPTSYANSQAALVIQDTSSPAIVWSDTGQARDWFAVAQGSGLYFNYADGGGSGSASNVTDVLVLDNSGNVGIGGSVSVGHVYPNTAGTYTVNHLGVYAGGITINAASSQTGWLMAAGNGKLSFASDGAKVGADGLGFHTTMNNRIETDQTTATRMKFYLNDTVAGEWKRTGSGGSIRPNQYSSGDTAANLPGLASYDDENTGVYWPAADKLGISVGGSQAVLIDSDRYMTVGNESAVPNNLAGLHVKKGGLLINGCAQSSAGIKDAGHLSNYWTFFGSSGSSGTFSGNVRVTVPAPTGTSGNAWGGFQLEVYISGYQGKYCSAMLSGYTNNSITLSEATIIRSSGSHSVSYGTISHQGFYFDIDIPAYIHPSIYYRITKAGDTSSDHETDFKDLTVTIS
jgi:hypothetical protein